MLCPIPFAHVKPLPITATSDNPCSTLTSQSCSSSATTVLVISDWVEPLGLSKVKATLISLVVIKSTLSSCFASTVNTFAKKPLACNIAGLLTVTKVCSRRKAIER